MKTYARVIKVGHSLAIVMTKDLREMGMDAGDWVHVELIPASEHFEKVKLAKKIEQTIPKEYSTPVKVKEVSQIRVATERVDFDPSVVGEKVLQQIGNSEYSDTELASLIGVYDGDRTHIQAVIGYIKEMRK